MPPTIAKTVPIGRQWLHELKRDGFRLIVHCDGDTVRLFTRRDYDWSRRFHRVIDQAKRLKPVIDAEVVCCSDDGVPDFDQLMSRRVEADVFAYGFYLLALDGDDLRSQPLEARKGKEAADDNQHRKRLLVARSLGKQASLVKVSIPIAFELDRMVSNEPRARR